MASTNEIHSHGFGLFKTIITYRTDDPKTCILVYKSDVFDSLYKNKQFRIACTTSSIEDKNTKKDDSTYTSEDILVTLWYSDIENTRDVKDTVNMPFGRFKTNNVEIRYRGKVYDIEEERENDMMSSVSLKCVRTR